MSLEATLKLMDTWSDDYGSWPLHQMCRTLREAYWNADSMRGIWRDNAERAAAELAKTDNHAESQARIIKILLAHFSRAADRLHAADREIALLRAKFDDGLALLDALEKAIAVAEEARQE